MQINAVLPKMSNWVAGTVGWGTALQAGRSRVRFLTVSLISFFCPHYGLILGSATNRNVYQEYFLGSKGGQCVELPNFPPSFADFLDIWEPQPSGTHRVCTGLNRYVLKVFIEEEKKASENNTSYWVSERVRYGIKIEGKPYYEKRKFFWKEGTNAVLNQNWVLNFWRFIFHGALFHKRIQVTGRQMCLLCLHFRKVSEMNTK